MPALLTCLIFLASSGCEVQLSPGPAATPTPGRLAPAMVQVENAPGSRPHWGLQQADVVYEYLTEGGISRFTVLYWNPSGGFRIEPVRSARLVTLRLLEAYGGVLFYSGASNVVQARIVAGHLPAVGESADVAATSLATVAALLLTTCSQRVISCAGPSNSFR